MPHYTYTAQTYAVLQIHSIIYYAASLITDAWHTCHTAHRTIQNNTYAALCKHSTIHMRIIYTQHNTYAVLRIHSTIYHAASLSTDAWHTCHAVHRTIQHNTYAALYIHSTIWYNTDPASYMPRIIQYNTYTVRHAHSIIYYTPIQGTEIHHKYNHTIYCNTSTQEGNHTM